MTTRPHLGGERRWFACPGCARRVGILYRPEPGALWRCRGCHGLAYRSAQQAHRAERLAASGGRDAFLRELSEADLPNLDLFREWLAAGDGVGHA